MTFAEFWPVYVRAHSRPATRVAHLVGTLGGWMLVGAAIAERRWWWIAAAVVLAYGLAWLAHFFVRPGFIEAANRDAEDRWLLHAGGENLPVVNFDFNAQRRPQVRALDDGASHP